MSCGVNGVKSFVRIIQFTNSLINEFSNKRMTIGEGEVVEGDGGEIYCPNYPIHLFSNKRITIGEGEVVRGDGVKSIVQIIQFTYSLINEFPNKRITIVDVVF